MMRKELLDAVIDAGPIGCCNIIESDVENIIAAVLGVLENPTPKMRMAGHDAILNTELEWNDGCHDQTVAEGCFRAMLRAAID